jgi:hypothetical protein
MVMGRWRYLMGCAEIWRLEVAEVGFVSGAWKTEDSTRETVLRRKMESSADCCSFAADTGDLGGVKAHPGPNACSSCIC